MQEQLDLLACDQARRNLNRAVANAHRDVKQESLFLIFAPRRLVAPRRVILEHLSVPVDRTQLCFDLVRRQSAGIGCTNCRSGAGASDAVDRNPQGFKCPQNTDVGEAAGSAS